jgi:anti-sigma factor RsiW
MNQQDDQELQALLKQAIAPVKDTELPRDLWPEMLKKLDRQPARVPWFDWALAALLSAALLLFPGVIPALLYHL